MDVLPAARTLPRVLAVIAAASLFALWVSQPPLIAQSLAKLRDLPVRWLTTDADFTGVVVADLAATELAIEATQAGVAPYRRETVARMARYLSDQGARAVVIDFVFAEPHQDDSEAGRLFSPNTVLAAASATLYPRIGSGAAVESRLLGLLALPVPIRPGALLPRIEWDTIDHPTPALLQAAHPFVGVVTVPPDADGVVRRMPLWHATKDLLLPSLPLAALLAAERTRVPIDYRNNHLIVGERAIPVTSQGEALVRIPRNGRTVPIVSAHRIALAASGLRPDNTLREQVRDKVVFLGSSAAGAPVRTARGAVPALQLHAVIYTQLARNAVLQPTQPTWNIPLALLAMAPGLLLLQRPRRVPPRAVTTAIGAVFLVAMLGALAGGLLGIIVRWPFALLSGLATIAIAVGWGTFSNYLRRRQRQLEKTANAEATRHKTEFLNHLTHELRTPLTAIMGFNKVNQFTDQLGRDQRISNSAVIARNCEHLLALINNNLDLAKIEAGQLAIQRGPENPDQIMRDLIATMRALAADKKIELRYTRRTTLPDALLLDAFRLRQVLINLLGNAVKFTSEGTIELAVAWHIAALEIEVRDTGPGIAPESLDRIWQPFKQADLTIGRRFGGTGLGLAISRKLVEMMGGVISVESKLKVGTAFKVRLPTEAVAPRTTLIEPASNAPVTPRDRLSGRILLADDNEDVRNLVTLLLRNLGLEIIGVENGLLAVEAAFSIEPDAILMDMEMPVMDGFEAVHVLRQRGYVGTILGLTAHQDGPEVARAILSGCDAVLSKPVSIDSLKAAIAPAIERRNAGRRRDRIKVA